jgi:hypothetical protein
MSRFWKLLAVMFVVGAPLWFGPIIYHDLTHPELWVYRRNDPRLYGPILLVILTIQILICLNAFWQQRRWDNMTPEERAEEAERNLRRYLRR